MDLSQLIIIAVAVAGAVIVGLLAIVPTMLELPRRGESDEPTPPTSLRPRTERHDGDHELAA
jgi:FlaG/FlaF family flagellin (archaellin)